MHSDLWIKRKCRAHTSCINTKIDCVDISFIARNLAILYKTAPHIDPETAFSDRNSDLGQEFGQQPSARSMGVNINIKL